MTTPVVLIFSKRGGPAKWHAATCPVVGRVNTRTHVVLHSELDYHAADLTERGYGVKRCPCCTAADVAAARGSCPECRSVIGHGSNCSRWVPKLGTKHTCLLGGGTDTFCKGCERGAPIDPSDLKPDDLALGFSAARKR